MSLQQIAAPKDWPAAIAFAANLRLQFAAHLRRAPKGWPTAIAFRAAIAAIASPSPPLLSLVSPPPPPLLLLLLAATAAVDGTFKVAEWFVVAKMQPNPCGSISNDIAPVSVSGVISTPW